MGAITDRASALYHYVLEQSAHGHPEAVGCPAPETLIVLGGVGGFLLGPLMVRRAIRRTGYPAATIIFDWHRSFRGDLLSDLMMLKRNRWEALRLVRRIRTLRREYPDTKVTLIGFSGGGGVAAFAAERLKRTGLVDTLILLAPALSPTYNLAPALRFVRRCYATHSHRDLFLLGIGTTIFGTIDRKHTCGAGQAGFRKPPNHSDDDAQLYERLRQIKWTPELRAQGHHGGHTAWVSVAYLTRHLPALLHDQPLTPFHVGAL